MQISWIDVANFIIAISGFLLAAYGLYLQRRDRIPRLIVESCLTLRELSENHNGIWQNDDFCVVLTLRNPTDKDIQVEEVYFVGENAKSKRIIPYRSFPSVQSHRTSEIILKRQDVLEATRLLPKTFGHFVVKDALGNISIGPTMDYEFGDRQAFFPSKDDWLKWVTSGKPELFDSLRKK